MARPTMAAIIAQVRLLVGDPASSQQTWSDDELQTFLDAHRQDYYYLPLTPIPTYTSTTTTWLKWYTVANGWWEDGVVLQDADYDTLTTSAEDLQSGIWTFPVTQSAVLLTGSAHDVHMAAADVCDAWIGKLRLAFDFTADGATFHRSQMITNLQAIAQRLRASGANGGVRMAQMTRSDVYA